MYDSVYGWTETTDGEMYGYRSSDLVLEEKISQWSCAFRIDIDRL